MSVSVEEIQAAFKEAREAVSKDRKALAEKVGIAYGSVAGYEGEKAARGETARWAMPIQYMAWLVQQNETARMAFLDLMGIPTAGLVTDPELAAYINAIRQGWGDVETRERIRGAMLALDLEREHRAASA